MTTHFGVTLRHGFWPALVLSVLILVSVSPTHAWTPPVPENADQFVCYEFGLPDDGAWTSPDACYSYALGIDPFAGEIPEGRIAYLTDIIVTPTSSAAGSYFVGVRESTQGGSGFNPQLFFRGTEEGSITVNNTAPLLTITGARMFQFFNATSSPGTVRFVAHGYIVDLPTDNHPFVCYEFGLSDDGSWTFPDACFSRTLGIDPISGGLADDTYAAITDVYFTPTSDTPGSYYTGVRQSTVGGSGFNPQSFFRTTTTSVFTHQKSPLLIIAPGNRSQFFNSTSSPSNVRAVLHGFIVSEQAFRGGQ